ncbi:MAG: paraquat-inducible protein A [Rhodospirillales bacterium]|nr:paraquat-inducible protein A [Rhodospirillales bacterium]
MTQPATLDDRLVRCHACDLLQRVASESSATQFICVRCDSELFGRRPGGFESAFVLYATAFILLGLANLFPFMTLKVQGQTQSSHLVSGAIALYHDGMPELAVAVVLFVILIPLGKILVGLFVIGPLAYGRALPNAHAIYRLYERLHPWAMMEIFLLGVLVSYTKLIALASVEIGPSLICFVALILAVIAADAAIDTQDVWERLSPAPRINLPGPADRQNLIACHTCQLLCPTNPEGTHDKLECPRCGSALHHRRPDSLSRTAALLMAAAILYVPANIFPVMTFSALGQGEPSTIIGGVRELIEANMWPLALIVFVASILVPVLKLISMAFLLITVKLGTRTRLRERTLIYRINEAVGRWSMVDVFVVSILVALVQLGSIAGITPGIGIVAFASVVMLTMCAAMSFDPRLIWDSAGANHEQ